MKIKNMAESKHRNAGYLWSGGILKYDVLKIEN